MELEGALLPTIARLNHIRRRYALRVLKLSLNHPIRIIFNKAISKLEGSIYNSDSSSDLDTSSKPLVQFDYIVNSIYHLIDLSSLEEIRHYYFPP
jgi:ribonuclease HI